MSDGYNISHLKITEEQIEKKGVSSLRNTPNRGSHFGTNGFSAADLKARFDELPKLIIERFNALLDAIAEGEVEFSVAEIPSLSALAGAIKDGTLGTILAVAPESNKTLADLAEDLEALDSLLEQMREDLDKKAESDSVGEELESIDEALALFQIALEGKADAATVDQKVATLTNRVNAKVDESTLTEALDAIEGELATLQNILYKKANAADVNASLSRMESDLAGKANAADVNRDVAGIHDSLAKKATVEDVNAKLAERDAAIRKKADKSTVDAALADKVALSEFNSALARRDTEINKKADLSALGALNEEITKLSSGLGGKADAVATAEALAKKADAAEVENRLKAKANVSEVEAALNAIRTALEGKCDASAVDTALGEIRAALDTKADSGAVAELVVAEVAKVVGTTKAALDTLEELAAALGNDENFAATVNARLAEIRQELESKANSDAVDAALAEKADKTAVDTALAGKANAADVTAALAGKADASELAKKANAADVTAALAAQVDEIEKKANAADVTAALAGKADASELAKKADASDVTAALEARDTAIGKKANASDVETELEEIRADLRGKASGISLDNAVKNFDEAVTALWDSVGNKVDASTLAEKENALRSAIGAKADAATVEELSNALAGKASLGALALKANASDIEELNAALAEKADVADLNEALAGKADRSEIDEQVNAKVAEIVGSSAEALNTLEELGAALGNDPNFAASVTESIGKKANASDVKTALAEKVDAVDLETKLGQVNAAIVAKANASYVETELTKRDTEIAKKANASYVAEELALRDREIAKKANAADMETALAKKANTSTVEAELEEIIATLAKKASISYVEAEIEKSNLEIAKKAGATAVNAAIEEINAELKKKASVTSVDSALEAIRTALDGTADRQTVEAAMAEIRAALDTKTDNEAVAELVVTEVAKVVGSTKDALDTLEELAAALGNDENFAATVNAKLAELRAALDTKADKTDIEAALEEKADKTDIEAALEEKADAAAVNAALAEKANASELAGKVDAADIENALAERDAAIVAKANASYVETELAKRDTEIAKKANASYVAEELALRDSEIAKKANADNMETALAKKANTSTVEAELEEINSALLAKADAATVEAALAVRDAEIALKATTAYVDEQLATRDAEIENKASRSYVHGNIERLRFDVDAYYYPKVSRLEKKVKNLEEAANPECTIVDDSVAYIKEIPFGALPYAEITEIGGRTAHPAKNLFDASKFYYQTMLTASAEGDGDHISFISGDRTGSALVEWTKTGEGGGEVSPLTDFFNVEVGRKYTIACSAYHNGEPFSGGRVIFEGVYDGGYVSVLSGERATITMTKETADGGIMVGFEYHELLGNDVYNFEFEMKIELYDAEALSLGITEATPVRVQELEIIGRNRMPTQYPLLTSETTSPERVTFTPMPDGSIVLNGTATYGISFFLFGNESEGKGGGEFRLEPGSYVIGGGLKSASVVMKVDGTHIKSGVLSVTAKDDYHDLGYVVYIYIPKGAQFDNAVIHPYLLKGEDVPSEIPAYSCTVLELPDLPAFGQSYGDAYNRIVFAEDGSAQYIQEVDDERNRVSPPNEYDLKEYVSHYPDNLIEVEGGGKITALNALGKQLPVPFTVIYQKDPYYEGGEE